MEVSLLRTASVEIEIPFHDVDSADLVWHGNYAKYLEIARCKLLDTFDYNYPAMKASGYVWPIIDYRLRFSGPSRFQQTICIEASLAEWEHRLKINYLITDVASGKRLTKGYTVQVAVDIATSEMLLASPAILYEKLGIEEPL
jgi:acyl-CoA thioester hydrolase